MVRFIGFVVALTCTAACNDDRIGGRQISDSDFVADADGPEIQHTPITEAQVFGQDVLLEATVSDESDVFTVEVYYQQETSIEWDRSTLTEVGGGLWQGRIKGSDVGSGGMRYYLKGVDYSDQANEGCLPEDCGEEAWRFSVVPE